MRYSAGGDPKEPSSISPRRKALRRSRPCKSPCLATLRGQSEDSVYIRDKSKQPGL
jgi:hypothetical protein